MYKIKSIFLTILIFLFACEPDDICLSEIDDTPKLLIGFYDKNSGNLKEVENLKIQGLDNDQIYIFETIDSIGIPLINNKNLTTFNLTKNFEEDNVDSGNNDKMFVNYNPNWIYISRACGYITNYDIDNIIIENDIENWIIDSEIITYSIKDEENIHVKIYH
ncbi:MAG: hypothetical protein CMD12_00500 [Flavobacteriales bacterium]|nr:hypothetical protein [Flavobacteriales bacterium]